ncbi:MAG: YfhO family protein [Elusimicrobiota bacterium]
MNKGNKKIAADPRPIETSTRPTLAWKELLFSTLIFAVILGALYGAPVIKSSGVYIHGRVTMEPGKGLTGFAEHIYITFPFYYLIAKDLHEKKLPLWTPYSCGGTPLMGKQQTGVFSPLHLLFYLIPSFYFKYLWFLLYAASFYLAWIFTFLLARWYGINFWGAAAAALCFVLCPLIIGNLDECPAQSAIYVPALFFMVEQFLRGSRKSALLLLPWLFALPFLIGHFETGFLAAQSATLYLLFGLWLYDTPNKLRRAFEYACCAILGLTISAGQIAAGMQYVAHSYTKVWRSSRYFGWFLDRAPKQLEWGDSAQITAVLAGLILFIACMIRVKKDIPSRQRSLWWMAALAGLSVFLAGLMNLGMTEPLHLLFFEFATASPSLPFLMVGTVCAVAVFAAWADSGLPVGLKIFSGLMIFALFLKMRAPILTNLLYKLPFYDSIYLDRYFADLWLGFSLILGWGLSRFLNFRPKFTGERKAWIARTSGFLAFSLASIVLAYRIANPLARALGRGINPILWSSAENPQVGGITDAGHQYVYQSQRLVQGWAPESASLQGIGIGIYQGNQTILKPARLIRRDGRINFAGTVALSPGDNTPVALVVAADGQRRVLRGSTVSYSPAPKSFWTWPLLIGLAAFVLLAAATPWGGIAASVAVFSALSFVTIQISRNDTSSIVSTAVGDALTQQWPFLKSLPRGSAADDPYRIYSPGRYNFPPAMSTIYGISDIRNGDDTMDVFTMIRFLNLMQDFWSATSSDLAAKIMGIGNVRYVLSRPNAPLSIKGLSPIYSGPDMLVYRNERFKSFARFYDRWKYLDGTGIEKWVPSGQILSAVAQAIASKSLRVDRDLLIHQEAPSSLGAPATTIGGDSSVKVLKNADDRSVFLVKNNRPGFLFISSNYFPGWKAYVDGVRTKIFRSWLTFSAIPLAPGRHIVNFIYEPRAVKLALLLSFLAALAWLIAWGEAKSRVPGSGTNQSGAAGIAEDARDGLFFTEAILTALALSSVLFWTAWCAWSYRGMFLAPPAAIACLLTRWIKRRIA